MHDFSPSASLIHGAKISHHWSKVLGAQVTSEAHLLIFQITASHFFWKMVRRLVGSLVEVGRERRPDRRPGRTARPAGHGNAERAGSIRPRVTAPPSGLFLEEITYCRHESDQLRKRSESEARAAGLRPGRNRAG
jgi:tRNA pseudouridine38-40 synthase